MKRTYFTISSIRSDKFNRINPSYEYALSDLTAKPFIHHSGTIIIPAHIDSKSLLDFVDCNLTNIITQTKSEHLKQIDLFNRLEHVLITDFKCKHVILNVSLSNGIYALKQLLNVLRLNYKTLDFDHCDLIIDYYYGTTTDGDVIIPWNFQFIKI